MRLDGSKHFGKLLHVIFPFDDDILLSFACAMELAVINLKIILSGGNDLINLQQKMKT